MAAHAPSPGPFSSLAGPADGVRTLIEAYLDEHRALGAAERFARWHEQHPADAPLPPPPASPATSRYQRLLPVSGPVAGQQLAFDVDLDACSGCKACVTACHSLNGLEPHESWRAVGLLVETRPTSPSGAGGCSTGSFADLPAPGPAFQHVTHACHHCLEPACAHGCPVLAYDKDPVTGIVRHLDDQCIGCSYCLMTCPYEVPRYSRRLGIVRKCDLCHGRLAVGEAPACAQACPNEAIRIVVTETAPLRDRLARTDARQPMPDLAASRFLPGTSTRSLGAGDRGVVGLVDSGIAVPRFLPDLPNPALTLPTTRFRSRRDLATTHVAADAREARPSPAHWPLVLMLVLTQAASGLALAQLWAGWRSVSWPAGLTLLAFALLALGLAASGAHLGQPLKAWRAFLGWRRSWLSREILCLSAFAALLGTHAASVAWPEAGLTLPVPWTAAASALAGIVGVFTSVRVYSATRRESWSFRRTAVRFYGTVLGSACLALVVASGDSRAGWLGLATVVIARLVAEAHYRRVDGDPASPLVRSAVLLRGRWRGAQLARVMLLVGVMMISFPGWFVPATPIGVGGAALAAVAFLVAEIIERFLFFRAVSPARMPGQPA